jgi:hypothetical protein
VLLDAVEQRRGTNADRACEPAFTLERYCHLLPGGEAEPLDLDDLGSRGNESHGAHTYDLGAELAEIAA